MRSDNNGMCAASLLCAAHFGRMRPRRASCRVCTDLQLALTFKNNDKLLNAGWRIPSLQVSEDN